MKTQLLNKTFNKMMIQNPVGTLFHTRESRKSSVESKIQVRIQWRTATLNIAKFHQVTGTLCLSFPHPSANTVHPKQVTSDRDCHSIWVLYH